MLGRTEDVLDIRTDLVWMSTLRLRPKSVSRHTMGHSSYALSMASSLSQGISLKCWLHTNMLYKYARDAVECVTFCSSHAMASSVIYYSTDAQKNEIYLFYTIIKLAKTMRRPAK